MNEQSKGVSVMAQSAFLHEIRLSREIIAAMAMQGLVANPHHADRDHRYTVCEALEIADLMIGELSKGAGS